MKFLILQSVAIFGLAGVLLADDAGTISLTPGQVAVLKHQLEAFEKGTITLDAITVDQNEEWGRELLKYYVTHTNDVTTKMKLPISRCLAGFGKYPEALQLAEDYVTVYSNDWHAWRIIGSANYFLENFKAALNAYTNAVLLGDNESCASLGAAALKTDRLDVLRDFVPRLVLLKNSKTSKSLQAVTVLVIYSLRTEQKGIFLRAVEGVNPKDILAHDDVTFLVNQGCKQFKGEDIDKIREEMESATSSTNSVSSPPR